MFVIGTAGHVDHGKSTLIRALTGIEPDRLREEQERQLTIDLGFAWMELPSGQEIGLVDVPGHSDFIENMLAGVGSIDAALFVVAADEGVMPQTREHLAILDLLEVDRGVIALTKIDMVEEPEWLELVEADVRRLFESTSLAGAPIVRVSGVTQEGLESLTRELDEAISESVPRQDLGRPRLSVDRVFTVSGYGTVVTGTLVDGSLEVGDEVVVLPGGDIGRVRSLQTHKRERERVEPGTRAAANISGVDVEDVNRGDVVAFPETYRPTEMLDVHVRTLNLEQLEIVHDQALKLFLGAGQRMARIRLLGGAEKLGPDQDGWLQLVLDEAIVAQRGDRYILRRPSPPLTLGGGQVADAHPSERHRLKDHAVVERLAALVHGETAEVLRAIVRSQGPIQSDELIKQAGVGSVEVERALEAMVAAGDLIALEDAQQREWYVSAGRFEDLRTRLHEALRNYHERYPLRPGMPREELRGRLAMADRVFDALLKQLESEGLVNSGAGWVADIDFAPELTGDQEQMVNELLERFRGSPYGPPTVKEARSAVGDELYEHLRQSDELVQVAEDVVFSRDAYGDMVEQIQQLIRDRGAVTVAEVRDYFDTSRKYAMALLEYLDRQSVTLRDGDERRLHPS